MVSRNTSILLAVAIIAIGAVAIIGVAYAYTASTENTGNTSGSEYITLSQEDTSSYTGSFNQTVKFNTVTNASGTTYTLDPNQLTTLYGNVKGVCLGTKVITVDASKGAAYFKFSVGNKTENKMTGTYYIGIKVGDNGTEEIREFDTSISNVNYYKPIGQGTHDAVTELAQAEPLANTTTKITVKLYLSAMSSAETDKPLDGVTFEFKAQSYVPPTP